MTSRVVRAARLDVSFYAELKTEAVATGQALVVVALVALAHGLGGVIRGAYFGWNPASSFLFGVLGEISFFAAASFVINLMARHVFGVSLSYPQVLRPFVFSSLPGLLILIAALALLLGISAEVPVFVVLVARRLAAGFIAIRRASGMNVAKSGLASLVGVASAVVAVAITSRTLVEIPYSFGVSS